MKCYICDKGIETVKYIKNMGGTYRPLCLDCSFRESRQKGFLEVHFLDHKELHGLRLASLSMKDPVPGTSRRVPKKMNLEELEGTWKDQGRGYK